MSKMDTKVFADQYRALEDLDGLKEICNKHPCYNGWNVNKGKVEDKIKFLIEHVECILGARNSAQFVYCERSDKYTDPARYGTKKKETITPSDAAKFVQYSEDEFNNKLAHLLAMEEDQMHDIIMLNPLQKEHESENTYEKYSKEELFNKYMKYKEMSVKEKQKVKDFQAELEKNNEQLEKSRREKEEIRQETEKIRLELQKSMDEKQDGWRAERRKFEKAEQEYKEKLEQLTATEKSRNMFDYNFKKQKSYYEDLLRRKKYHQWQKDFKNTDARISHENMSLSDQSYTWKSKKSSQKPSENSQRSDSVRSIHSSKKKSQPKSRNSSSSSSERSHTRISTIKFESGSDEEQPRTISELWREIKRLKINQKAKNQSKKEKLDLLNTTFGIHEFKSTSEEEDEEIEITPENDIYRYISQMYDKLSAKNKNLSEVKKRQQFNQAKFQQWDSSRHKNLFSYLRTNYYNDMRKLGMSLYDCIMFVEQLFFHSNQEKVRQIVQQTLAPFVVKQRKRDKKEFKKDESYDYPSQKYEFTTAHLRCLLFPRIAHLFQDEDTTFAVPEWNRDHSVSLADYFIEILENILIKNNKYSSKYNPSYAELKEAMDVLIGKLREINENQIAHEIMSHDEYVIWRKGGSATARKLMKPIDLQMMLEKCHIKAKSKKKSEIAANLAQHQSFVSKENPGYSAARTSEPVLNGPMSWRNNSKKFDYSNSKKVNNRDRKIIRPGQKFNQNRNYRTMNRDQRKSFGQNKQAYLAENIALLGESLVQDNSNVTPEQAFAAINLVFDDSDSDDSDVEVFIAAEDSGFEDYLTSPAEEIDSIDGEHEVFFINNRNENKKPRNGNMMLLGVEFLANQSAGIIDGCADTGASLSLIPDDMITRLNLQNKTFVDNKKTVSISSFNGKRTITNKFFRVEIKIGLRSFEETFAVIPAGSMAMCRAKMLLGKGTLQKVGAWQVLIGYFRNELKARVRFSSCPSLSEVESCKNLKNENIFETSNITQFDEYSPAVIDKNKATQEADHQKVHFQNCFANKIIKNEYLLYPPSCIENYKDDSENNCFITTVSQEKVNLSESEKNINKKFKKLGQDTAKKFNSFKSSNVDSSNKKLKTKTLDFSNFGYLESSDLSNLKTCSNNQIDPLDRLNQSLQWTTRKKIYALIVNQAIQENPGWDLLEPEKLYECISSDFSYLASQVQSRYASDISSLKVKVAEKKVVIEPYGYQEVKCKFTFDGHGVYSIRDSGKRVNIFERVIDTRHEPITKLFIMNNNPNRITLKRDETVAIGFKTNIESLAEVDDAEDLNFKEAQISDDGPKRALISTDKIKILKDSFSIDDMIRAAKNIEFATNQPLLKNIEREIPEEDAACCIDVGEENANFYYAVDYEIENSDYEVINVAKAEQNGVNVSSLIEEYNQKRREEFDAVVSKLPDPIREAHEEFYNPIFNGNEPGKWATLKIRPIKFKLKENHPKEVRPQYRNKFGPEESKVIDEFIITNLSRNIISKGFSNYNSPLLLVERTSIKDSVDKIVKKKEKLNKPKMPREFGSKIENILQKKIRVALDFRKINKECMAEARDSVPEIADLIARAANAAIFSAYDVEKGYWMVDVDSDHKKFTGFTYDSAYSNLKGSYYFNVAPFGIASLPSIFSRIVNKCFRGMERFGTIWYLDDLLQPSGSISDDPETVNRKHGQDLRRLFGRAKRFGFKFSIEKAVIGCKYIGYLGFKIGQGQVLVSDKTVRGIDEIKRIFKVDGTKKDYETVMGFFNYSMKFIENFAAERNYVNKLRESYSNELKLKKNASQEEKEKIFHKHQVELDKIFEKWKTCIINTRLQIPEMNSRIHIFTDASFQAFGYNLYTDEGNIVEFGGKVQNASQKNYDIICLELEAILQAVNKFKVHIARASEVVVHVDNKSAVSYLNKYEQCHSERSARLVSRILMFPKLKFVHVGTKANNSDLNSRLIDWKKIENQADEGQSSIKLEVPRYRIPTNKQLELFLLDKPRKTSVIQPTKENTIDLNARFRDPKEAEINKSLKKIDEQEKYLEKEENAANLITVAEKICMLAKMSNLDKKELIRTVHEDFGPHCGQFRLFRALKTMYPQHSFPKHLLGEVISECPECTKCRVELPANTSMKRFQPKKPLDLVSIDHFQYTTVTDRHGYTSVFSIKDEFSRFITIIPVYTHSIKEAVHNLKLYVAFFGQIGHLHYDNFFDCAAMNEFCEENGIDHSTSPGYRSNANGAVERCHRDLRKTIPLLMERLDIPLHQWSDVLHLAATHLNLGVCRMTGFAPYMLMRGCMPNDRFANAVLPEMQKIWDEAYENMRKNQKPNLKMPPKKKGIQDILEPGTPVWLHLGKNGKKAVSAVIVLDNGCTAVCKKDGFHTRFGSICVHKSRISKKLIRPRRLCRNIYSIIDCPAEKHILWKE